MRNELLIIIALIFEYSVVVLSNKYFGKIGLHCWMATATILANIEVMILVDAFNIEMTLGNTLFASTFLVTDILNELYGEKEAKRAVKIGMISAFLFALLSISWLLYIPSENSVTFTSFNNLFSFTPRIVLASLLDYPIVQLLDVIIYQKIWHITTGGDKSNKKMWMRSIIASVISQFINSVLYNLMAFYGTYSINTLVSIIISTTIILVCASMFDIPFLYWAKNRKNHNTEN